MFNFIKPIAVMLGIMAIALFYTPFALADEVQSNVGDTAQQAAQKVVQDTGVKEQFGKSPNGERLLEQAQQKANQKLQDLGKEADKEPDLPTSKKLFLKNLSGES